MFEVTSPCRVSSGSPNAVSAAAEYLPLDFEPTVVPRASLKYEVPLDEATGLPPPTCGSFMNCSSPRWMSARPSQIKVSVSGRGASRPSSDRLRGSLRSGDMTRPRSPRRGDPTIAELPPRSADPTVALASCPSAWYVYVRVVSPSVTESRVGNNEDNSEDNFSECGSQPRAGFRHAGLRSVLSKLFFKLFTLFPHSLLAHSIPEIAYLHLGNLQQLRQSTILYFADTSISVKRLHRQVISAISPHSRPPTRFSSSASWILHSSTRRSKKFQTTYRQKTSLLL